MVRKAQQALPNQSLRQARKQRGWTQQQVADGIGAPLALNVMRWERGMTRPSAHYVQRLCQLFDMSAEDLGECLSRRTSGALDRALSAQSPFYRTRRAA